MANTWIGQLDLLIRSGTPLIWIRSHEEERVEGLLRQTCQRLPDRTLASWDFVGGLSGVLGQEQLGARQPMAVLQWLQDRPSSNPTLLLLKDVHRFCDDPGIARMLRNLASQLRTTPHTLIVTCGQWTPPADLDEALTLLDLPLPQEEELRTLLANIARASGRDLEADVLEELTHACCGLSEARVRHVAAKALAQRGSLSRDDLADVLEEKRLSLARSEVLEFCRTDATPGDIGGLETLKHWLDQRHRAFNDDARRFGLPLPRGVLLVVRHVAAKALAQRGSLSRDDLADVLEEKRLSLARSEVLEFCRTDATPGDIGGLETLKHWLDQRHRAFNDDARRFGLPLPRGVLLVGPQGTGKSLTARAIAHSWSMPLLRLDVGRLFSGLVGASEARTRDMIQLSLIHI